MIIKISNLPINIPKDITHLAASGNSAKVEAGPTKFPNPGPTLVIAVAALEILVTKSRPIAERLRASSEKLKRNKKKNAKTVSVIFSEIGLPL